jgi:hypothetical protein
VSVTIAKFGAWRSWLAHQLGVLGVARSNRVAPTDCEALPFEAGPRRTDCFEARCSTYLSLP